MFTITIIKKQQKKQTDYDLSQQYSISKWINVKNK